MNPFRRPQTRMPTRRGAVGAALACVVVTSGCSALGSPPPVVVSETTAPSGPNIEVEVIADGLENPWDIGVLPDGSALVAERPGRVQLISTVDGEARMSDVTMDLAGVYATGEGGLMGLVVHPDFATSRQFTACLDYQEGGEPVDIRLVTWQLSEDGTAATKVKDLLTGLPVASSGRHSGCRPTIAQDGALLVGTGDTAIANIPQDRTSLGGKVLRLDLNSGKPLPGNPFVDSDNANERYVYTFGHRNIQGVALRPGVHDGEHQVFTAEHGPSFDDEVNLIKPGANYGWDPSKGGTESSYDESVPMTDMQRFPEAVPAVWESGETTQAICGATFLTGQAWGDHDGALAVTALKGAKLLFLNLTDAGDLESVSVPAETDDAYGRLRAARTAPDGSLLVTTSNGDDDKVLRITPTTDSQD